MSKKPDVRNGDSHKKTNMNNNYRAAKKAHQDEDARDYDDILGKLEETLKQNTMLLQDSKHLQHKNKTLQRDLRERHKVLDKLRLLREHRVHHVKSVHLNGACV